MFQSSPLPKERCNAGDACAVEDFDSHVSILTLEFGLLVSGRGCVKRSPTHGTPGGIPEALLQPWNFGPVAGGSAANRLKFRRLPEFLAVGLPERVQRPSPGGFSPAGWRRERPATQAPGSVARKHQHGIHPDRPLHGE